MFGILICLTLYNLAVISEGVDLEQAKEDILNSDDFASAYEKYAATYDMSSFPLLQSSTDKETYEKEQKKRKNLFISSLKSAKDHNTKYERGETTYKMTVNRFFTMDTEEKEQHLGLNGGQFSQINQKYNSSIAFALKNENQILPSSFNWKSEGYLTKVKNQGSCGSCWAFGAIVPMEWAYAKITGNALSLSEQNLLDCVYESSKKRNGCNGGWYMEAWDYVIDGKNTNGESHVAKQADYGYKEKDNTCVTGVHANALKDLVKVTGYVHVSADETSVLKAVAFKMPLAVAITVEREFYVLGQGKYDGCKSKADPNHAVVLTGYGKDYFEIRNSWGTDWGVGGYGKLERRGDICNILSYAFYIEFEDISGEEKDKSPDNQDKEESEEERNKDDKEDKEDKKKDESENNKDKDEKEKDGDNNDKNGKDDEKKDGEDATSDVPFTTPTSSTTTGATTSSQEECMDNPHFNCRHMRRRCRGPRDHVRINCPVTCGLC